MTTRIHEFARELEENSRDVQKIADDMCEHARTVRRLVNAGDMEGVASAMDPLLRTTALMIWALAK